MDFATLAGLLIGLTVVSLAILTESNAWIYFNLPAIDRIVEILARAEGGILVSGHTDNQPIFTSQFRSNWDLSTERAVSVVHRLLKDKKIDPKRITAMGFGDSRPLKSNDTPEGRSVNRRVEIAIEMVGQRQNEKNGAP